MSDGAPANTAEHEKKAVSSAEIEQIVQNVLVVVQDWFSHNCVDQAVYEENGVLNVHNCRGNRDVWIERTEESVEVTSNMYGSIRCAEIFPGDDIVRALRRVLSRDK